MRIGFDNDRYLNYDDAFAAAVEYSILLAKVTKRIRESAVMDA